MIHKRSFGIAAAATAWLVAVGHGQSQLSPSALRNHPSIAYAQTAPSDRVAQLNDRLQRGDTTFQFEPGTGYLKSVLKALDVSVDSQVLVFSKTSFQARRINPQNPRALYFNDTVSVGWVRGGEVLEFLSVDPRQGAMFYTLEQVEAGRPQFRRDLSCVQCHTSEATLNVPGMFVGSVFPAPDGMAMYGPAYNTDHRSPFDIRWGGWYVTGDHRVGRHMANAVATSAADLLGMVTPETLRVSNLDDRFDMTSYLSKHSDIVALMVLEHQARMVNLITRVGWEARLGPEAGRPLGDAVAELVDYMLFVDEQPLSGPIEGPSAFAATFPARGPRDTQGRSLRDLELGGRLMRYPCSYMIYSTPFEALPAVANQAVYARMWEVLSGQAREPRYARLTPADRRAVVQILTETKAGLPDYFVAEWR